MDTDPPRLVYKVCAAAAWARAVADGVYRGSPVDARDGFIHLSTGAELAETLRRHFVGQTDLVLVTFDAADLAPDLRWEPSRGGALFPHVYGAIDARLARAVEPIDAAPRP